MMSATGQRLVLRPQLRVPLLLLLFPLLSHCDVLYIGLDEGSAILYGVEGNGLFGHTIVVGEAVLESSGPELIVAAPGVEPSRSGVVYVFGERLSEAVYADEAALVRIEGDTPHGFFGGAMALCDVDGNGHSDLLIGAPSIQKIFVFLGPLEIGNHLASSANVILTGPAGGSAGFSMACLGDINHDGVDDIAIGDPNQAQQQGAVYIQYGSRTLNGELDLDTVAERLSGEMGSSQFGSSMAMVGNVQGSSSLELLVGAPRYSKSFDSREGAAYLFSLDSMPFEAGAGGGIRFEGATSPEEAGTFVAAAGNIDNDAEGLGDFLIGAPFSQLGGPDSGTAYLIYGQRAFDSVFDLAKAPAQLVGSTGGDHAGVVGLAGNILDEEDGSRFDDILVGAPTHLSGAEGAGAAYLIPGPVFGEIALETAVIQYEGISSGDHAGSVVLGGVSIIGDGRPDVIVGAPGADSPRLPSVGTVVVFESGGM